MSFSKTLRRNITGTNVGNMLFQQSVIKTLSLPKYDVRSIGLRATPDLADRINNECDMLVLPYANAFRPSFTAKLEAAADLIEKLKIPVLVVGIGCQTDLDYNLDNMREVDPAARRFIRAVLERSPSIGVRGECTAAYVRKLGFSEVEVIGCPSMFMEGRRLAEPRPVTGFWRQTAITVNVSAAHGQAAFSAGLETMGRLIDHVVGSYPNVTYVPQENGSAAALYYGHHVTSEPEHAVIPRLTYQRLLAEGRIRAFVDPRTWFEYLATRDFVFGTRLHGGIAGLLAGTPSHLIAHDSRLKELAEYNAIPFSDIRKIDPAEDPQSIYERSDFSRMVAGHSARFDRYAAFLKSAGLSNTYDEGDNGMAFEQELARARLAKPIVPVSPTSVRARMRRNRTTLRNMAASVLRR